MVMYRVNASKDKNGSSRANANGRKRPRSSHLRCSFKKSVLKNFVKFTEKLWHRCFPVNFAIFFKTPFLQNNSG